MSEFPDYKKVSVEKLIPYARNSRTHSAEQVDQIAASIKEFGFLNPIVTDGENGIVACHGRVMAAKKLGLKELPCIDASHLTETQRRAYIIADNKIAINSDWDTEMLRVEFDELQEMGFDIELTGFSLDEIAGLQFDDDSDQKESQLKDNDYSEAFSIVIDCKSESEQKQLFERFVSEGLVCRVQSL